MRHIPQTLQDSLRAVGRRRSYKAFHPFSVSFLELRTDRMSEQPVVSFASLRDEGALPAASVFSVGDADSLKPFPPLHKDAGPVTEAGTLHPPLPVQPPRPKEEEPSGISGAFDSAAQPRPSVSDAPSAKPASTGSAPGAVASFFAVSDRELSQSISAGAARTGHRSSRPEAPDLDQEFQLRQTIISLEKKNRNLVVLSLVSVLSLVLVAALCKFAV